MKLHHCVLRVDSLLDLIHPPSHNICGDVAQVNAAHQCRGSDERILVDDRGFQIPVNLRSHGGVQNPAKHTNRVRPEAIVLAVHILDEARVANEDLRLGGLQVFDNQINHSAQARAWALEELGHIEEEGGHLFLRKLLALLQKVQYPCKEAQTLLSINRCVAETSRLLQNSRLVLVCPWVDKLFLLELQIVLQRNGNLLLDSIP
mmetsp:Transcript_68371/g.164079  ORF Transcript_68371/g.164079 Transcript_68371/m.164079 type:complete len:204 (+) Transcript_68371:2229-2840(+)